MPFYEFDTKFHQATDMMTRIKDPELSSLLAVFVKINAMIEFSCSKVLQLPGMRKMHQDDLSEQNFSSHIMAYDGPESASYGAEITNRQSIVELLHDYGSKNNPDLKIANGNCDHGNGFGHLYISVDHF